MYFVSALLLNPPKVTSKVTCGTFYTSCCLVESPHLWWGMLTDEVPLTTGYAGVTLKGYAVTAFKNF